MARISQIAASIFGLLLLPQHAAKAETIYLKDGSNFAGSVVHFYENTLHLVLASGDTLIINKNELLKIEFAPGQTSGNTATPSKKVDMESTDNPKEVVEAWIKALKQGDQLAMSRFFISSAQAPMLEKLNAIPAAQQKQIQRDAKKTKFVIGALLIDGDQARLKLTRTFKQQSQEEELILRREAGLWKLVPND